MSVDINIVSHMSNKSYEVLDTSGNIITENTSNNIINLPYDTSYVIYIEPQIEEIGYTGLLNLSSGLLSGIFGYIWIIIIGILLALLAIPIARTAFGRPIIVAMSL